MVSALINNCVLDKLESKQKSMSRRRFKTFGTNLISAILFLILDKNILLNVLGVPTQCINYHNLTEENRNRNNSLVRIPVCETEALQIGWYRFTKKAGSILTSKPVQAGMCSALNPGRLLGRHPCTIHKTIDAQVCFADQNDCGKRVDILITFCGEYYVYRLPGLNCSREMRRRYCGEDSKVPISSCNTTNINPTKSIAARTTNQGRCFHCFITNLGYNVNNVTYIIHGFVLQHAISYIHRRGGIQGDL